MRKFLMALFLLIGALTFGTGCQEQKLSISPTITIISAATGTTIPNITSTATATPIPSPTTTFPAPASYQGTTRDRAETKFGLGGFGNPVLSPDENYLAVTSRVGIILYHPETLTEISILSQEGQLGSIAWSPDSKKLAVVTSDKDVAIWDVEKAKPIQKLTVLDVTYLVWSPDGQNIALADGNRQIEIWDLKSAKLIQSFSSHALSLDKWGRVIDAQWINGNEIVSLDDNAQIFLWEIKTGKIVHTWKKNTE